MPRTNRKLDYDYWDVTRTNRLVPILTWAKRRAQYNKWRQSDDARKFIKRRLVKQLHRCFYCNYRINTSNLHVDHITPLWRGGLNVKSNYVLTCRRCNLDKQASAPNMEAIKARQQDIVHSKRDNSLAHKIIANMPTWKYDLFD